MWDCEWSFTAYIDKEATDIRRSAKKKEMKKCRFLNEEEEEVQV